MAKQPDWQRTAEGILFIVIGIIILLLIPTQVAATPSVRTRTSPAFIPRVVAVSLMITGAAMTTAAFTSQKKQKKAVFEREGMIRAAGAMLLLWAYTSLFSILGFVITSSLFMVIFSLMFGSRSVLKIAAAAVLVPSVVWVLFEYIFRVPLPHGLLF